MSWKRTDTSTASRPSGAAMPLDPNHLPGEIALIESFAARLPGVPQVATK